MSSKTTASAWQTIRLNEVVEVVKGKKPRSFFAGDSPNKIAYLEAPFLRGQRESKYISPKDSDGTVVSNVSDVLVLWDGYAGDVFYGTYGVVASTMVRVQVTSKYLLPDFLYFTLLRYSSKLRETAAGTTVKHIRRDVFNDLPVHLPPIPVQERIVKILWKAKEINRKCQEASKLADEILPATCIGMFGNPSNDYNNFSRVHLGEIADIKSGVMKGRNLRGKETIKLPYLRVANIQDGFLDLCEIKTIEVLPGDAKKYHLTDGDVLMTEGGDPDKLGRGCVWQGQVENCIYQNHVFRVRTNREKLLPEYLAALLRTQYAKHYFLRCAKRSSNLASINSTQVKAFPVPLPPIALQQKFVSAVEQWFQAAERLAGTLNVANSLLDSIMSNAFTGALTAEWEVSNAGWIKAQIELHQSLPRLLLLALIREKTARTEKATQAVMLVTALMKYAFLLQMEGNGRHRFYHFVPYHYGPFAKEVYGDLAKLREAGFIQVNGLTAYKEAHKTSSSEGWMLAAENQAAYVAGTEDSDNSRRIEIVIDDLAKTEAALADLPGDLKEAVAAILDNYGDLDHNALLKTVYNKYPTYAKKSRLRKNQKSTSGNDD